MLALRNLVMKNKLIKSIAIAFVLLVATLDGKSQNWFRSSSLEFGLMGAATHYSGDLTNKFFETKSLTPGIGLITRLTPGELLTFRLSANYGKLKGDDEWYATAADTVRRNLNFESVLWDFTAAAELNLRRVDQKKPTAVIPYLFGGVSVYKFNPTAIFNYDSLSPHINRRNSGYETLISRDGEKIELHPLSTEGQGTTAYNQRPRYALTQVAATGGLGLKFKLSNNWVVALEYGLRHTFTDFLDDVSGNYVEPDIIEAERSPMAAAMAYRSPNEIPGEIELVKRGDDKKYDLYGIFGVQITYRIYSNRPRCFSF